MYDKNGTPLYEGDTILHNKKPNSNERYERVIIFRNGCFGYERKTNKTGVMFQPLSKYFIGNQRDRLSFWEKLTA